MLDPKQIKKGRPLPLGNSICEGGVNFAIFSKHAEKIDLCLFDPNTRAQVARIALDPKNHKTGDIWHILIEQLSLPILYGYHVDGDIDSPYFFDSKKIVLDPYAKILCVDNKWGSMRHEYQPYGSVMPLPSFDWKGVTSPNIPYNDLVIYEMHVRGFTADPSSKVSHPGTFLGVIEKIPYLLELGINAVELMPIYEFDESANERKNPDTKEDLFNYWGYSSINFFAPMQRYATSRELASAITEFKTMVRELHANGIEVILDVVYNHTGEKKNTPHAFSFMALDRPSYYLLEKGGVDSNYTGCGNTVNTNYPVTSQLIIDSLRYWVTEMQVDGFRFDLACIFNRDMKGHLVDMASIMAAITYDPILSKSKLIAEPWDAAGAYQLGRFVPEENRWSEWNGKYRDVVRRFLKGDLHSKNEFAHRLCGSEDLFSSRTPQASINFVTAHDGFTLADLVSYNKKHNLANGENNHDGNSDNMSFNFGVEGPTDDINIMDMRSRQMKNFMIALMVSNGVPMILMGDEYGHTKHGNNNTWCHDGVLNFFLWDKLIEQKGFYRFVKHLIRFRLEQPVLRETTFREKSDIVWHGVDYTDAKWSDGESILGFTLVDHEKHESIYVMFNATSTAVDITLPPAPKERVWHIIFDTYAKAPHDCFGRGEEVAITTDAIRLHSYSSILLKAL